MWNDKRWRCRKCNQEAVNKHRQKKMAWCREQLGGACQRCGYSKCAAALEFHHRDPTEKEFGIGAPLGKSYAALAEEMKKCDLLCANCHREIHWEINNELVFKSMVLDTP